MEPTSPQTSTASSSQRTQSLAVFDRHHPPSSERISECVHCGFCLASCPTYQLWGEEADSPRGRIYLMKLGLDGEAKLDAGFVGHFDRCLGCMACLTSCPSGVKYDELIEATRAQVERRFPRSDSEKIFRRLIFQTFPYPNRLRFMAVGLWLYQRSGLAKLARSSGLVSLLPPRLRAIEDLSPEVIIRTLLPLRTPPTPSSPRLRVGLLLGCVQQVFFADVNRATARVLAAEGCEVVIPPGQGCCGALMTHAGEESSAMDFARRTIDAFESENVDVIAINAAGCGSAMKEYGRLLRDDPAYSRRATALAAKCRDISEILISLPPIARRNPLPIKVAYHDACHLQHAQRITAAPRQLLRAIPGLRLIELPDAGVCCGSAGIYNLLEPEAASELGRRKAQGIADSGAVTLVSGNPGCTLQLQSSLRRLNTPIRVLHWVQLLESSLFPH